MDGGKRKEGNLGKARVKKGKDERKGKGKKGENDLK